MEVDMKIKALISHKVLSQSADNMGDGLIQATMSVHFWNLPDTYIHHVLDTMADF